MGIAYTLIKDFRVRNPFIFFTAVAALDRASEGLSIATEIAENGHGISTLKIKNGKTETQKPGKQQIEGATQITTLSQRYLNANQITNALTGKQVDNDYA